MKKILILFALLFGLMSVSPVLSEEKPSKLQLMTCCTVTAIINGEPGPSETACVLGIGPETENLACSIAMSNLKKKNPELEPE